MSDYDGLVLPGGVANPDLLRGDDDAVAFVRGFVEAGEADRRDLPRPLDARRGRRAEGPHDHLVADAQTDIENAGGNWVDEEVHVDEGLVSSRNPDDLPAFCEKIVEEFCEGEHEEMAASAPGASA